MPYFHSKGFEKAIHRSFLHTRSRELEDALEAIRDYEREPSKEGIQRVSKLLTRWRSKNPKEFQARGSAIEADLRAELKSEYAKYGLAYGLGTDLRDAQPWWLSLTPPSPCSRSQPSEERPAMHPRHGIHAWLYPPVHSALL